MLHTRLSLASAALALFAVATPAVAATFADSFDYADTAALGGAWSGTATLVDGLQFAGIASSGKAVQLTDATVSTPFGTAVGGGVTMWTSFLVRQDTAPGGTDWGTTGNLVGSHYSSSAGSTTGVKYRLAPLHADGWGAYDARVGTGSQFHGQNPTHQLAVGQTYFALSKIENLGHGDWSDGAVKLWVFTEAAFAAWQAAGGSEAALGAHATDSAVHVNQTWAIPGIAATDLLNLQSRVGTATLDEYRAGATLADVAAVPEPAAATLGLAGATLLLARRRK